MKSRVKWFNNTKGFGFIEFEGGEDIFVHYSAIKADGYKTLSEGQEVSFNLVSTNKGYQAHDVEAIVK
jgi:cold shock protein